MYNLKLLFGCQHEHLDIFTKQSQDKKNSKYKILEYYS